MGAVELVVEPEVIHVDDAQCQRAAPIPVKLLVQQLIEILPADEARQLVLPRLIQRLFIHAGVLQGNGADGGDGLQEAQVTDAVGAALLLLGQHDDPQQLVLTDQRAEALDAQRGEELLLVFPHAPVHGGAGKLPLQHAAAVFPEILHQRMLRRQGDVFLLQRAGGKEQLIVLSLHPHQRKDAVHSQGLLGDVRELAQDIPGPQQAGNLLAEAGDQHALLLIAADKQGVDQQADEQIQKSDEHQHAHGHDDQGMVVLHPDDIHQEILDGQQIVVRDQQAQDGREQEAVGPGDQHGHTEQLLFVQRIEQQPRIHHAGEDVQRKALEKRQCRQDIAQEDGPDAAQHRDELEEHRTVALAVAPDQEGQLAPAQHHQQKDHVDLPGVVVDELNAAALLHHLRPGDQAVRQHVEDDEPQEHHQPEKAPAAPGLLQKIKHKVVEHNRDQENACKRYIMPKVHRRPQLDAHGKGAAAPEDEHKQEHHEGVHHLLGLFCRQERHKQNQIAGERYDGDPTISTHI